MLSTSSLQKSKVFALLPLDDLQKLAPHCRDVFFSPNAIVLSANAAPMFLALLIEGSLHAVDVLEDGRLCNVGMLLPGDCAGWLSAIDNQPTNTHIVAASQARVLLIPLTVVRALLAQRPAFALAVLKITASTIRHYMRTRAALSAPNAAQRLHRVLLGLAQDHHKTDVIVLPKQHELAVLANTSRETVSRTLNELIRSDILEKNGHRITVKDFSALQQLANRSKT